MPVKKRKKKPKVIFGQAAGHTLGLARGNIDTDEDWINGMARVDVREMTAEILLHSDLKGRSLLATLIHEVAHVVVDILRLKVNHRDIHSIGNLAAEILLSTKIVNEGDLERRLKKLGL